MRALSRSLIHLFFYFAGYLNFWPYVSLAFLAEYLLACIAIEHSMVCDMVSVYHIEKREVNRELYGSGKADAIGP